jgi:hypothetical protein
MTNVLEESKAESAPEIRADVEVCCGHEMQEMAKRIEKGVNDAKAAVSAKLDYGRIAARRLLKRGRYAVEDGISETAHKIKRYPVSSLAICVYRWSRVGLTNTSLLQVVINNRTSCICRQGQESKRSHSPMPSLPGPSSGE